MSVAAVSTGANYPACWVSLFVEGGIFATRVRGFPVRKNTVSESEGEVSRPTVGDFVNIFHRDSCP